MHHLSSPGAHSFPFSERQAARQTPLLTECTTVAATTLPTGEARSSCDNTPFGCCPDGKTTANTPDGSNCPCLSVLPFFTTSATTVATATPTIATTITTTTTGSTMPPTTTPITTHQPTSTRRPFTTGRTTTTAPITSTPPPPPTTISPRRAPRPCDSHPCGHGGTCEDDGDDFNCTCPVGRGGAVCEKGPTCADSHNPCEPSPCHPSAHCHVLPEGGYKCECPMGREGKHCRKLSEKKGAYIPYFSGDSYLELKGLHLYGHDLRYECMAEYVPGFLTKTQISPHRTQLRSNSTGYANWSHSSDWPGLQITLMGTSILKADNALHSMDVSMYTHHPCSRDVCENGGECNPLLESYECVCPFGFTGPQCQHTTYEKAAGDSEAIAFDGRTFIEYHNGVTKR
ncbi:agrin isoform X2 [Tachysurus ichikawai]